jgi:hypothetical protein
MSGDRYEQRLASSRAHRAALMAQMAVTGAGVAENFRDICDSTRVHQIAGESSPLDGMHICMIEVWCDHIAVCAKGAGRSQAEAVYYAGENMVEALRQAHGMKREELTDASADGGANPDEDSKGAV